MCIEGRWGRGVYRKVGGGRGVYRKVGGGRGVYRKVGQIKLKGS